MKKGYIYSLNDPINDVPRYIGLSTQLHKRFMSHINSNERTHKGNWIKNLRKNGLKPKLEILDEVSVEEIKFWEIHYISLYKSWGFKLVNGTLGGDGTLGLGKPYTKEMIEKALETRKRNGSIEKVTKINKENGLFEWAKNRMLSSENPGKKQCKAILQYDFNGCFIKEWESAADAGKKLNISRERIGRASRGRFKTAGGFQWRYKANEIVNKIAPITSKSSLRFKKITN